MKLEGTHTILAPRDLVWQRLMNPQVLARALPGCEKMEQNADGSFGAELKVEAKGTGGFVKGEATLSLAENAGGTLITYSGEAQVGGLIASVGQRLIQSAA